MKKQKILKNILFIIIVYTSSVLGDSVGEPEKSNSEIYRHEKCYKLKKESEEYSIEFNNTRDVKRLEFLERELKRIKEEIKYYC